MNAGTLTLPFLRYRKTKILCLVFVLGAFGIAVVRTKSFRKIVLFPIQNIQVIVEAPISESDTLAILVPLKGKSLLMFDSAVWAQELKKNPWAEKILLRREFPHDLLVTIQAKKPVALLQLNRQLFFLDNSGTVIGPAKQSSRIASKRLHWISTETSSIKGWNLAEVTRMAAQAQSVLSGLTHISEIVLGEYPFIRLFLTGKREVWLRLDTFENQLPLLKQLFEHPPPQIPHFDRVDLTFPKKAVVRSFLSK